MAGLILDPLTLDPLETRSPAARADDLAETLPRVLAHAMTAPGFGALLAGVDPAAVRDRAALARLPVLRKAALAEAQASSPPFGGFAARLPHDFAHVFQSPGPIYEPGQRGGDWWRIGRFLRAAGIGPGDIVQNCFAYHLTPAGLMFENGCEAVGAAVLPAGPGQTELQVQAAVAVGTTAYAGTPDYLKVLLDAAEAAGARLSIAKAAVSGGALFPALREAYAERGIACLQCYATADLGLIAYESLPGEPMIVDEGVVVEIVRPGTGDPVPDGEVGEVVVTTFNPDYPLIRFATGDLSAVAAGTSPCGRTNQRLRGWMGRADQTAKVKGMFVRPEQVAAFVARHPEVARARVVVERAGDQDALRVLVETAGADPERLAEGIRETLKLRGAVEILPPGSLPNDGKVIEDLRKYA